MTCAALKKAQIIFLILVLLSLFGFSVDSLAAKSESQRPELMWLQKATDFLRSEKASKVRVSKSIQKSWGSNAENSSGQLFVMSGMFRWETVSPEKVWMIFDGQSLWTVRFASPDFPGKNKVVRFKVDASMREKEFMLKVLKTKNWSKEFSIVKNEGLSFFLIPNRTSTVTAGLKNLRVQLTEDHVNIKEVSYSDDLDNQTTLTFEKPQDAKDVVDLKNAKQFFVYSPDRAKDEVEEH